MTTRRYNMFPHKTYGGQVEAEVQTDGRIKYTLYPFPCESGDGRTLIIDPAHAEDQRAIRQLHLVETTSDKPRPAH